jgi:REP element-mobilizing transposase RayT
MVKTVGYMITWTTYGTWLQGDARGYVKDGQITKKNERLRQDNEQRLAKGAVRFGAREEKVVKQAIKDEADKQNVKLHAITVRSNHVHVVVGYCGCSIEDVVRQFKQAGIAALKERGVTGKVWTRGYDKRFCFDEKSLHARIAYVNRHGEE